MPEILLGREALVSRNHPEFAVPGRGPGKPLADRHLSRKPFSLRPDGAGGIVLVAGERRR